MKKNKIFVACDTNNIAKVKDILKKTQSSKFKIGWNWMELYGIVWNCMKLDDIAWSWMKLDEIG